MIFQLMQFFIVDMNKNLCYSVLDMKSIAGLLMAIRNFWGDDKDAICNINIEPWNQCFSNFISKKKGIK